MPSDLIDLFIAEYLRPRLPESTELPRDVEALVDRLDRYRAQTSEDNAARATPDGPLEKGDQQ